MMCIEFAFRYVSLGMLCSYVCIYVCVCVYVCMEASMVYMYSKVSKKSGCEEWREYGSSGSGSGVKRRRRRRAGGVEPISK